MTRLTRNVLFVLFGLYIAALVAQQWLHLPVVETLAWWPFGSGQFRPWQPLSSFLVNDPTSPIATLLDGLFLFFLLPSVERSLGKRELTRGLAVALGVALVFALSCNALGAIAGPSAFLGISPVLIALIVFFGLANPSATILLFFIIPIRAIWLVWGTGLLALVFFLSSRDLSSALCLGAWVGAWVHLDGTPRRLWLRLRYRRTQQKLRRLRVLEGGRSPRTPPDGPVYH